MLNISGFNFPISAQNKTRTCTPEPAPAPQAGVSTNFTIWALILCVQNYKKSQYMLSPPGNLFKSYYNFGTLNTLHFLKSVICKLVIF